MAKLTADEFIKKYTEGDTKISDDDDRLIELMEDASDSIKVEDNSSEVEKIKAVYYRLSADYVDLKERYRNRFLDSRSFEEKEREIKEPEEKVIIDIKEI